MKKRMEKRLIRNIIKMAWNKATFLFSDLHNPHMLYKRHLFAAHITWVIYLWASCIYHVSNYTLLLSDSNICLELISLPFFMQKINIHVAYRLSCLESYECYMCYIAILFTLTFTITLSPLRANKFYCYTSS